MDKYLWEELAVSTEGVVSAYVKPGPKAQQIKNDTITINIEGKSNAKDALASANTKETSDNVLKTLEEECFAQLKTAINEAFPELKSVYLALPIECFREIAEKLPTTKAELLEIDQMTHFRFERFGSFLLEVCQDFNAKRMNYLEDKQLAEMMAKAEEAKVFNTPSSNNPIYKNDTQRYVLKFGFSEKAKKFEKNLRRTFDKSFVFSARSSVLVKKSTKIFQNKCGQVVLYKLYICRYAKIESTVRYTRQITALSFFCHPYFH